MQKHISASKKQKLETTVFDIRDKLAESGLAIDKRQLAAIILLLIVTIAGSALFYISSRPKPVVIAKADENKEERTDKEGKVAAGSETKAPAQLYIHVAGAVAKPGVYQLIEGSRVVDAVEAAGGEAEGATLHMLNLAAKLIDGQRVYVPKKGESTAQAEVIGVSVDPAMAGGMPSGGKININLATAEQLDSLSGVGEVTAKKIIAHRTKNGPFKRVEDIMRIDGIGKKKFEKLKDEITVE